MNLQEFRWFRNPRGLHNNGPYRPLDVQRYLAPRLGWARLVAGGDEYIEEAAELVQGGCMPIIRIDRTDMGAMAVPEDWYAIYRAYINAGCLWFELYDAPNTPERWPKDPDGAPRVRLSWENMRECIQPLMDNWITWAERLIGLGAYPAFPAMAQSGQRDSATVYWLDAALRYLKDHHYARFMQVIGNGLWAAIHAQIDNRFYQEPPGGPSHVPRPYYQYSAAEPGWHFEHPYDPVMQRHDFGRTVFGATAQAEYGDPHGLIASGQAFQELLRYHFEAGPVPVIGVSGGIAPVPAADDEPFQQDSLYPPYTAEAHAEATLAMMRWVVHSGPYWFFGVVLSNEAAYYDWHGTALAVKRLAETEPDLKDVPDIDTGGIYIEEPFPEIGEPVTVGSGGDLYVPRRSALAPEEVVDADAVPELPSPAAVEPDLFMPQPVLLEAGIPPIQEPAFSEPVVSAPEAGAERVVEPDMVVIEWGESEGEEEPATEVPEWLAELITPPEESVELAEPAVPGWIGELEGEEFGPEEIDELVFGAPAESIEDEEAAGIPVGVPPWLSEEGHELAPAADMPDTALEAGEVAPPRDEAAYAAPAEELPEVEEGIPQWLAEQQMAAGEIEMSLLTAEELLEGIEAIPVPAGLPAPSPAEQPGLPETAEVIILPAPVGKAGVEPAAPVATSTVSEPAPVDVSGAAPAGMTPDHHWVVLAPDLDAGWFFDTAWHYMQQFQPAIMGDWRLLGAIPAGKWVVITLIATQRSFEALEAAMRQARPDAGIDLIVVGQRDDLQAELDWRATTGKRLG